MKQHADSPAGRVCREVRTLGNYAVLGWGSLIWDLDDLAPKVDLPWQMSAGPRLPMEFTRISPKRKMGLAVCLDPDHGELCATHAIASRRGTLEHVIEDLAARERAPLDMIGGVCRDTDRAHGRPAIAEAVTAWCEATGWVGAVWTDLRTNYTDHRPQGFSIGDASAYLRTLEGESLVQAVRYIHYAPTETDTPLRRALAEDPWWLDQVARIEDNKMTNETD